MSGPKPPAAPVDGVLVVDKPLGVGSTDVVRVVRRASEQRRVGHTGTLDPLATGVLVVCLGRATRLVRFLQAGSKTYVGTITLGVETTTYDVNGDVVAERSAGAVDEAALRAALPRFIGDVSQVPPMVSAIKVGGERLYRKAQRGEEVERAARAVTITSIDVVAFEPGERAQVQLEIVCSAGTYVRSLAHDLGAALGCGGTLAALRRTRNGTFTLDDACTLDEVRERGERATLHEVVMSPLAALRDLPAIEVDDDGAYAVRTGRQLPGRDLAGPFAVVHAGSLLAVYESHGDVSKPEVVMAGAPAAAPQTT